MKNKLISLISVLAIAVSMIPQAVSAADNTGFVNFGTRADEYYNMLDKSVVAGNGVTMQEGNDGKFGKTVTVTADSSGEAVISSEYPRSTTAERNGTPFGMAQYFAFMYKYTGADTTSTIDVTTITRTGSEDTVTFSYSLKGDGAWHMALCANSAAGSNRGYITKIVHTYASANAKTEEFTFADYRLYDHSLKITKLNEIYAVTLGNVPDRPSSTTGNYIINSVEWKKNNAAMGETDVFEPGGVYSVTVSMTAKPGYMFDNSDYSSAFRDAQSVTADLSDTDMTENSVTVTAVYDSSLAFVSSDIADGTADVSPTLGGITVNFSKDIDFTSITDETVSVTPSVLWHAEQVGDSSGLGIVKTAARIVFDEILVNNTEYTISLTGGIKSSSGYALSSEKSIKFRTSENYPDMRLISSSISDGAANVAAGTGTFTAEFDLAVDAGTVNKDNITVSPETQYSVSANAKGFTILFEKNLLRDTHYTISWDGVKSVAGTACSKTSLGFSTEENLKNLFVNGNLDSEDISAFNAPSDEANPKMRVEENGNFVLRWKTGQWSSQPIFQTIDWTAGHRYLVSVDVTPDKDCVLCFDPHYPDANNDEVYNYLTRRDVAANSSVTLRENFTIPANMGAGNPASPALKSMRLVSMTEGSYNIITDNWQLYDRDAAPRGSGAVIGSSVADGTSEMPVQNIKIALEFDKAMDPMTISNITSVPSKIKNVTLDENLTTAEIEFDTLDINTEYKITVSSGVKTMYGDDADGYELSFRTFTVSDGELNVSSIDPADGAVKVGTKNRTVNIVFDNYVDKTTINAENITVSPNVLKEIIPEDKGARLVFDDERVTQGTQYTVTVGTGVKSLLGKPMSAAFTSSFTTKSRNDIVESFNAAATAAEKQSFMENEFDDLLMPCDLYDSLRASSSSLLPAIYRNLTAYTNVSGAEDLFAAVKNTVLSEIANNGTAAEVRKMIESNTLGLNSADVYYIYGTMLSENDRQAIAELIVSGTYSASQDIKEVCAEKIILYALSKLNGWESVKNIFNKGRAFFTGANNIDSLITAANARADGYLIYNKLQSQTFASLGYAAAAFRNAYNEVVNQAGGNPAAGGGGSGGSSGGWGNLGKNLLIPSNDVNEMPDPGANGPFNDLDGSEWAKDAIIKLYEKGIVSGKGNGGFAPKDSITREEFVKLFIVAVNEYNPDAKNEFSDLDGHWSAAYVASAVSGGFISGVSEDKFGAGENISREDMAAIIYRYLKDKNLPMTQTVGFADEETAADYAKDAIAFLHEAGIVSGDENGNFRPFASSTRAEAVVMIDKMLTACGA